MAGAGAEFENDGWDGVLSAGDVTGPRLSVPAQCPEGDSALLIAIREGQRNSTNAQSIPAGSMRTVDVRTVRVRWANHQIAPHRPKYERKARRGGAPCAGATRRTARAATPVGAPVARAYSRTRPGRSAAAGPCRCGSC